MKLFHIKEWSTKLFHISQSVVNATIPHQSVVHVTIPHQSVVKETIRHQSVVNETIPHQSKCGQCNYSPSKCRPCNYSTSKRGQWNYSISNNESFLSTPGISNKTRTNKQTNKQARQINERASNANSKLQLVSTPILRTHADPNSPSRRRTRKIIIYNSTNVEQLETRKRLSGPAEFSLSHAKTHTRRRHNLPHTHTHTLRHTLRPRTVSSIQHAFLFFVYEYRTRCGFLWANKKPLWQAVNKMRDQAYGRHFLQGWGLVVWLPEVTLSCLPFRGERLEDATRHCQQNQNKLCLCFVVTMWASRLSTYHRNLQKYHLKEWVFFYYIVDIGLNYELFNNDKIK